MLGKHFLGETLISNSFCVIHCQAGFSTFSPLSILAFAAFGLDLHIRLS